MYWSLFLISWKEPFLVYWYLIFRFTKTQNRGHIYSLWWREQPLIAFICSIIKELLSAYLNKLYWRILRFLKHSLCPESTIKSVNSRCQAWSWCGIQAQKNLLPGESTLELLSVILVNSYLPLPPQLNTLHPEGVPAIVRKKFSCQIL